MFAQRLVFQSVLMVLMLTNSHCARVTKEVEASGPVEEPAEPKATLEEPAEPMALLEEPAEPKAASVNAHGQLAHSLLDDSVSPSFGSSELANGHAKWGGGSDVCRQQDLASTAVVDRYHYKVQKFKALATRLEEKACGMSCPQKWLEMKSRMQHFMSCTELLKGGNASNIPHALQEAMTSSEDSLPDMQRSMMDALAVILKKYDFFPKFDDLDGCEFKPSNLNVEKAAFSDVPEGDLHVQLFGPACSSSDATEYMARLKGDQQRIASMVMEQAKQVLALAGHPDNSTGTQDVLAKLTKEVAEHDASLNKEADALMSHGTLLEVADVSSPKLGDLISDIAKDSEHSLDVSSSIFEIFMKFLGIYLLICITMILLVFVAMIVELAVIIPAASAASR